MVFHFTGATSDAKLRNVNVEANPETLRFYSDMVEGWCIQLHAAGNLKKTVDDQRSRLAKFRLFTGHRHPWEWTMNDVDRWGAGLARQFKAGTVRGYQLTLKNFLAYAIDPVYDWNVECERRYGCRMRQLCRPENTFVHRWGSSESSRRPLTAEETEQFFGALRARMQRAAGRGRKGAATAARDYALFATSLGWGLRAREVARLEQFDLHPSPEPNSKAAYGRYGVVHVRWGKAKRRGGPKARPVLSVPAFDNCIATLRWYLEDVRPQLASSKGARTALWLTERGKMITEGYISGRFRGLRNELGLSENLTMHCLRSTYSTRLIEAGYPPPFVQVQLGHDDEKTLGDYAKVSDDFKLRTVRGFLERARRP